MALWELAIRLLIGGRGGRGGGERLVAGKRSAARDWTWLSVCLRASHIFPQTCMVLGRETPLLAGLGRTNDKAGSSAGCQQAVSSPSAWADGTFFSRDQATALTCCGGKRAVMGPWGPGLRGRRAGAHGTRRYIERYVVCSMRVAAKTTAGARRLPSMSVPSLVVTARRL